MPRLVFFAGGIVLLIAGARALLTLLGGGSIWVAAFDLLFGGIPGGALMYAGYWMPRSDISREYYPRIIAWVVGGVAVMFGFIVLRDLHPGVSVNWTTGTQAIALMIGSVGGLLIGIQETRATIRTAQLEERNRELAARERLLARQNERLEEFADMVSHDLRNPLGIAIGRLEIVRQESDSEHLDVIEDALDRMDALVDDLLTLARTGDGISNPEPTDIATLADTCWGTVETDDATIETDLERRILVDESRVKQLLENLFRNAIEHGGENVAVSIGELTDGFFVEDDGPGIPVAERDDVFETGYSTRREGTGFGLRIVRSVARDHEWSVDVTEGTDGGARFEFTGVEWASDVR